MQVIQISEPLMPEKVPSEPVVLAMGFFDGVHCGHQAVIQKAKQIAVQRGLKLALMTFDRFPKIYFKKIDPHNVRYLTTLDERLRLFEKQGIDITYVAQFNREMAALSPQDFVDRYMVGLHAQVIVAGFDYTFGKPELANMERLPIYARSRFKVVTVSCQKDNQVKIGTTQIKEALSKCQIEKVNHLLGYRFHFNGLVVHGKARGRELGFPTLNIQPNEQQWIPGNGVYAVRAKIDNHWYQGMASVSHNETFGDHNSLTIEVNLFDFDQMVYGKTVTVEWDKYLRPSVKFASIAELIKQLNRDRCDSIAYFVNDFK